MSLYEQNIRDFSGLYADCPELFTQKDLASFSELKATFSEEDSIEKISDAIALWCEAHPHIYNALLEIPVADDMQRGPGGRTTPVTSKGARDLLENIVRTEPLPGQEGDRLIHHVSIPSQPDTFRELASMRKDLAQLRAELTQALRTQATQATEYKRSDTGARNLKSE